MVLRKLTTRTEAASSGQRERRSHSRDLQQLSTRLHEGAAGERRWAARDLADYPAAADLLCIRLAMETNPTVREVILNSLIVLASAQVADGLLPLLRSDDAGLRNGVIEVLQQMPEATAPRLRNLMDDPDPGIRIFAIDILRNVSHPEIPIWLSEHIEHETDINVVGNAIDCLAEVGMAELIPKLKHLKQRFAGQPYIQLAIDTTITRISEH